MRWIPALVATWCLLPFPFAVGVGRMFAAGDPPPELEQPSPEATTPAH